MLRRESRVRARALQILYAWELQGRPAIRAVADGLYPVHGGHDRVWEDAERLALAVATAADELDGAIVPELAGWRLARVGVNERNILRLAAHELRQGELPAPVIISEALRLTHWFAGAKAGAFINGVLDALARRIGRL
ncbi:MAG: transcription antitermination factor NusB [Gemmatimonadota bacterium]|nr:transcription antitermination factor NusB [Gemmatimonadota bacterium]